MGSQSHQELAELSNRHKVDESVESKAIERYKPNFSCRKYCLLKDLLEGPINSVLYSNFVCRCSELCSSLIVFVWFFL